MAFDKTNKNDQAAALRYAAGRLFAYYGYISKAETDLREDADNLAPEAPLGTIAKVRPHHYAEGEWRLARKVPDGWSRDEEDLPDYDDDRVTVVEVILKGQG